MLENQNEIGKKRKNYPGDERTPGTKDYSMILGNLINYKHQLSAEKNDQKIGELFLRIAEKLRELGYRSECDSIKKKAGRRKAGKFQDITEKKKNEVVSIAIKCWDKASEKNDMAKIKMKEEEKKSRSRKNVNL